MATRSPVRPPSPAPPAPRVARGELPFLTESTDHGPLHVHRVTASMGARIGRAPLVAALGADPAMLAHLALDPALAGCDPRGALFVDTETTGLSGGTGTVPFLIGIAWFDASANAFVLEQFFLRKLGEEAPMLARLAERIAAASMLVTYNGKSFDLPLLRTRFVMNRMRAPTEPRHLDLVHVARRIHKGRLTQRTLKSIEEDVLGRVRLDDVGGADIPACYMHFLRTGDDEGLHGVVEHNADDVWSMVALLGLYGEPLGEGDGDEKAYVNAGLVGNVPQSHIDANHAPRASAGLNGIDLAGAALTLRRAGALEPATRLADAAVLRGGGPLARRARGAIAKACGDVGRALEDYEALALEVDDPKIRLELAKLYEHNVRAFASALAMADRGTGESDEALDRRKRRLERKLARLR